VELGSISQLFIPLKWLQRFFLLKFFHGFDCLVHRGNTLHGHNRPLLSFWITIKGLLLVSEFSFNCCEVCNSYFGTHSVQVLQLEYFLVNVLEIPKEDWLVCSNQTLV